MSRARHFLATIAILAAVHASPAAAKAHPFYSAGSKSSCISFDTTGVQIVMPGSVKGQAMWFTLDTGASGSVMDSARAAGVGLQATGHFHSFGAGGQAEGSQVDSVTVALPGFEMRDLRLTTLDLRALSAQAGHSMDGILGHEVFENCVVEVDYLHGCVTLHDANKYRYTGKGASVPLEFKENHPYVTASITVPGGRTLTGQFVIDTGSGGTLILAPDVVAKENLIQAAGRTISSRAHGVGGVIETKIGRIERLDLGPYSFANPTVTFQPPGAGYISAPGTLGNIGGNVLNRFTVIFDYKHRRMILEPNAKLGMPFDVDMTGMSVVSTPPDYHNARVQRVMDDSPAAGAGVQVGDEIEKVNGVAVSDLGIAKLRRMMKVENSDLQLELKRGAEPVKVTIRTRRLI